MQVEPLSLSEISLFDIRLHHHNSRMAHSVILHNVLIPIAFVSNSINAGFENESSLCDRAQALKPRQGSLSWQGSVESHAESRLKCVVRRETLDRTSDMRTCSPHDVALPTKTWACNNVVKVLEIIHTKGTTWLTRNDLLWVCFVSSKFNFNFCLCRSEYIIVL